MKNLKYFGKKITPFVLAGSIMATMTACGKEEKDNVLDGTILENTIVATTDDGNVYLVEETINNKTVNECKDSFHYKDVISGNYYHLMEDENDKCPLGSYINVDFETMEPISLYLTKEELLKGDFTKEEIVDIINRVVISRQPEGIQKTKKVK